MLYITKLKCSGNNKGGHEIEKLFLPKKAVLIIANDKIVKRIENLLLMNYLGIRKNMFSFFKSVHNLQVIFK